MLLDDTLAHCKLNKDANVEIVYESKPNKLSVPIDTTGVTGLVATDKYLAWCELYNEDEWGRGVVKVYDIASQSLKNLKFMENMNVVP